jgi:hypothetical protein
MNRGNPPRPCQSNEDRRTMAPNATLPTPRSAVIARMVNDSTDTVSPTRSRQDMGREGMEDSIDIPHWQYASHERRNGAPGAATRREP